MSEAFAENAAAYTVLWLTRRHATLLAADGSTLDVRYAREKRPVVGDRVLVGRDRQSVWIDRVLPRGAVLQRRTRRHRRGQVLAANLSGLGIVTAVGEQFRSGLVDRLLVTAAVEDLAPLLILNKVDDEEGLQATLPELEHYQELGVETLLTSAKSGEGMEALRRRLSGEALALVGHSGVGKSSLLNALLPEANRAVGALSERTGTGRHVTTSARGFPFDAGGLLVDMPGVRLFGLVTLDHRELARGFVELRPFLGGCRFPDCTHSHEPSCAVREAVERGDIRQARYDAYLRLLAEIQGSAADLAPG